MNIYTGPLTSADELLPGALEWMKEYSDQLKEIKYMKPASAKSKGRALQKWLRGWLIELFKFAPEDCRSTSMGVSGEDIQLSNSARNRFPFAVECKNVEKINIWEAYEQAEHHAVCTGLNPLVVVKKNGKDPIAILDAHLFLVYMHQLYGLPEIMEGD